MSNRTGTEPEAPRQQFPEGATVVADQHLFDGTLADTYRGTVEEFDSHKKYYLVRPTARFNYALGVWEPFEDYPRWMSNTRDSGLL